MNIRWTVAAAFLCSMTPGMATESSNDSIVVQRSYFLSKEEVGKYSREAMAGSAEAANKLTNMYWMRGLPDRIKTKYWAVIGAENGDAVSQFVAFQILSISSKQLDQERALFWLRKSAAQGFQGAQAYLASCPEVSSLRGPHHVRCFGPGSDR